MHLNREIFFWWFVTSLWETRMDRFYSDRAYNLFLKAKHQAHWFNKAGLFETINWICVRGHSSSWVCFLFMSSVRPFCPKATPPLPIWIWRIVATSQWCWYHIYVQPLESRDVDQGPLKRKGQKNVGMSHV